MTPRWALEWGFDIGPFAGWRAGTLVVLPVTRHASPIIHPCRCIAEFHLDTAVYNALTPSGLGISLLDICSPEPPPLLCTPRVMSHSSGGPWSSDPNAPQIPHSGYAMEKAKFAGNLASAIAFGIVIVLFSQCMMALFDPVNRTRGGIKWLLLVHTTIMFFVATANTAIALNIESLSYIDNRRSPGTALLPPGPLGYLYPAYSGPMGVASTLMFLVNNWLAGGLLLYRCFVIYAMNRWVVAVPFLLYLATFATGILLVCFQILNPSCTILHSTAVNVGIPYSISVSLDVLLTLMIVGRLVLLNRQLQKAINSPFRIRGLHKTVIAVLSESSALYATAFLLFIGTWAASNPVQYFFFPVLFQAQVIAPFLIVIRVAKRKALTNDVVSGSINFSRLSSGGWEGSDMVPSDKSATSAAGTDETTTS